MQDPAERLWTRRRLLWKLRGAKLWPAFAVVTVAETIVLHALPPSGERADVVPVFLICGFANLAIMAAGAPLAGRLLRRRRPALPLDVAADTAGTVLIVGLFALLTALGVAHRGSVDRARASDRQALAAARAWFARNAPREFRPGIGHESVWKQGGGLYRTCVHGPDPHRDVCVYVDLSGPAPRVARDPDQQPNSVIAGPDNPGRLDR